MEGQNIEAEWFQESWPMLHQCLPSSSIHLPHPTSISKERVIYGLIKDGSSKHIPSSSSALKTKKPLNFSFNFQKKILKGSPVILSGSLCHGRSSTWSLFNVAPTFYAKSPEKRYSLNCGAFPFINEVPINSLCFISLRNYAKKGMLHFYSESCLQLMGLCVYVCVLCLMIALYKMGRKGRTELCGFMEAYSFLFA